MIIYDRGHKRVPGGIDLFTPEGDPHAISCRRRAAHGWPRSPPPPPRVFILLLLLLLVVYVNPPKLRFLISSFAAVTAAAFTTGVSRLNSGIYELHRRRGTRTPAPESLPTNGLYTPECAHVRACVRAYMYVCSGSR